MTATERSVIMQRHGANLARFLDSAGTSRGVAARAMGVSRSTLLRMTKGTAPIRLSYLGRLADELGTDFFELGMIVCGRTGSGQ